MGIISNPWLGVDMKLESKSIRLRLIETTDAEFVLNLRLDEKYNQFLSPVAPSLENQIKWIQSYKEKEVAGKEFYFIIERLDGVRCGTVRVYDIVGNQFTWGSWILNEDKTRYSSIESAMLVYKFAFVSKDFERSVFDVMKGNEKVISFHEKFGAKRTANDEVNVYFELSKEDYQSKLPYFESILEGS